SRVKQNELLPKRARHRLCAAVDAELPENVIEVKTDGLARDVEAPRDCALIESLGKQSQYLVLPRRQTEGASPRDASMLFRSVEATPDANQQLVRLERLR